MESIKDYRVEDYDKISRPQADFMYELASSDEDKVKAAALLYAKMLDDEFKKPAPLDMADFVSIDDFKNESIARDEAGIEERDVLWAFEEKFEKAYAPVSLADVIETLPQVTSDGRYSKKHLAEVLTNSEKDDMNQSLKDPDYFSNMQDYATGAAATFKRFASEITVPEDENPDPENKLLAKHVLNHLATEKQNLYKLPTAKSGR